MPMEDRTAQTGFRAAPLWLRFLAGGLDLGLVAGVSASLTLAWFHWNPTEFPPRYWNHLDYLVDVINTRPDLIGPPVILFVVVFLVWETLFGWGLGNSPFGRLLGMRVCTPAGLRPVPLRFAIRALLSLVGSVAAMAGPLVALAHPERKMLHDIVTGCYVLTGPVPRGWERPLKGATDPDTRASPHRYQDGPRR